MVTRVQSKGNSESSGVTSVTLDSTPTAGNVLVAQTWRRTDLASSVPGLTGAGFTKIAESNGSQSASAIWAKVAAGTEGTISQDDIGASSRTGLCITEYSGVASITAVQTATDSNNDPPAASLTGVTAGNLVFGSVNNNFTISEPGWLDGTPPTGYTEGLRTGTAGDHAVVFDNLDAPAGTHDSFFTTAPFGSSNSMILVEFGAAGAAVLTLTDWDGDDEVFPGQTADANGTNMSGVVTASLEDQDALGINVAQTVGAAGANAVPLTAVQGALPYNRVHNKSLVLGDSVTYSAFKLTVSE